LGGGPRARAGVARRLDPLRPRGVLSRGPGRVHHLHHEHRARDQPAAAARRRDAGEPARRSAGGLVVGARGPRAGKLGALERRDPDAAGELLFEAFARAAREHGHAPPWPDAAAARALAERALAEGLVADADGAIAGVGFARVRGDAATIGPLAALAPGRGTGGRIVDELVARAEGHGATSVRGYQDGWNPASFALLSGRSFAPFDVIACLERPAAPAPRLDAARGMEFSAFR